MWSYFRGWKRKIGVVMLATACVFAAGWVRSKLIADSIELEPVIRTSKSEASITYYNLTSMNNRIAWDELRYEFGPEENVEPGQKYPQGNTQSLLTSDGYVWDDPEMKWHWRTVGIGFGEMITEPSENWTTTTRQYFLIVSYWFVTIPLTLISAWCLLSKARSKPTVKPEPVHA
jgi:hypothetical protein